jgi:aspartate kinase
MDRITCKFGGSSLADADCFRQVRRIIEANPGRRFIVPSAPGKRHSGDKKITDLLYAWHSLLSQDLDATEPRRIIAQRFRELAQALEVDFDTGALLEEVAAVAHEHVEADYMASRGEYLNGQLMAAFLGATLLDPADCIRFDDEGRLDPDSYAGLGQRLEGDGLFVIPGFYGSMPDGRIKTFSRGGSDITGAIVARATRSDLYENWTDVSGFRMADPRIVPDAQRIEEITYGELRELSYMGAKVLHDEAIFPVREPGIPINIRNTHDPENPGTRIVAAREATKPIVGIAGKTGFTMVSVEKTLMNKERGFVRRVLQVFEEHSINIEHIPTGIDTMSVIADETEVANHGVAILKAIERTCEPDRVSLQHDLAIIATVGQGMAGHYGIAAKLFTALAEANINIRVIDQGSSENNIITGVETKDLEKAVAAIYEAFTRQE